MSSNEVGTVLILAFAVGSASITLTKSLLFAPLRGFVVPRSNWFGELLRCPYCTSHWLAAAALVAYPTRLVHVWAPGDYFVTWLVLVALSTFVGGLIYRAYE